MKKPLCEILRILVLLFGFFTAAAQNEPFTKRTVVSGLNSAWEVVYGPNDSLWVTENRAYLISRISIATGAKTVLVDLRATDASINFTSGIGTQPQGGLQPGDFIVWHAAAGGVGLIACQWARAMGLELIATAGSDAKCALALANGAAHAINLYAQQAVRDRVMIHRLHGVACQVEQNLLDHRAIAVDGREIRLHHDLDAN